MALGQRVDHRGGCGHGTSFVCLSWVTGGKRLAHSESPASSPGENLPGLCLSCASRNKAGKEEGPALGGLCCQVPGRAQSSGSPPTPLQGSGSLVGEGGVSDVG